MPVRPGYRGSFGIHIDYTTGAITYAVLSLKTMQIRETVDNHDTSGTASPKTSTKNILQETRIAGKARCRVNIGAQWGADGGGDPPDFTGEKLYGNHAITAQAGSQIVGIFLAEDFGNSLNESGTIDYDMSFISDGAYERTNP